MELFTRPADHILVFIPNQRLKRSSEAVGNRPNNAALAVADIFFLEHLPSPCVLSQYTENPNKSASFPGFSLVTNPGFQPNLTAIFWVREPRGPTTLRSGLKVVGPWT